MRKIILAILFMGMAAVSHADKNIIITMSDDSIDTYAHLLGYQDTVSDGNGGTMPNPQEMSDFVAQYIASRASKSIVTQKLRTTYFDTVTTDVNSSITIAINDAMANPLPIQVEPIGTIKPVQGVQGPQ